VRIMREHRLDQAKPVRRADIIKPLPRDESSQLTSRNQLGKNIPGMPFDPDELARKYHAGVAESELRRFEPSGKFDPEVLRRMLE